MFIGFVIRQKYTPRTNWEITASQKHIEDSSKNAKAKRTNKEINKNTEKSFLIVQTRRQEEVFIFFDCQIESLFLCFEWTFFSEWKHISFIK